MPSQRGIAPRIRIGRRWFNTLWALPIGAAALLCLIALAQSLREFPSVAAFIRAHPGIAQSAPSVDSGFPWWLQLQHFLNMLFMLFILRAGLQILADHPRLYWGRDCTPGSDWFRFQVPVPKGRLWTAKDDSVTLPKWLGIPGLRHTLGLARWWHFAINLLWLVNGVAFYALLFSTDQWRRLVPLTWEVFPAALSTAIQYASLNFPVDEGWTRYNGLQQLSYFITVFVAAPVSIATGLMQSPAISNALGWFGRVFKEAKLPLMITQGDQDNVVPPAGTRTWAAAMDELGMEHEYIEKPGLDHGTIIGPSMNDIFRFFAAHKRTPPPPFVPPPRPAALQR